MSMRANLEKMLASGRDDALLRFTLGEICLNEAETDTAVAHLRAAVEHDPEYSAAWKLYGKALTAAGDKAAARQALNQGLAVAQARGDNQAANEMRVFLKRLDKPLNKPQNKADG